MVIVSGTSTSVSFANTSITIVSFSVDAAKSSFAIGTSFILFILIESDCVVKLPHTSVAVT